MLVHVSVVDSGAWGVLFMELLRIVLPGLVACWVVCAGVRVGGLTVCSVVAYAVKLYLLIVLGSFRIGYCLCLYLQLLVMDCLLLPLVWFCLGWWFWCLGVVILRVECVVTQYGMVVLGWCCLLVCVCVVCLLVGFGFAIALVPGFLGSGSANFRGFGFRVGFWVFVLAWNFVMWFLGFIWFVVAGGVCCGGFGFPGNCGWFPGIFVLVGWTQFWMLIILGLGLGAHCGELWFSGTCGGSWFSALVGCGLPGFGLAGLEFRAVGLGCFD